MASLYFNNTICERDMDLMFVESVLTDSEFCNILLDKANIYVDSFQVVSAELSKSDSELGESDITVVIEAEGLKYGLLIEDKIDAIAMPEQHARYIKRGEKGVKTGDYHEFRVFIFCPEKYYKNNDEAKRYEHFMSYEECKAYFAGKTDPLSIFRYQQLEQVLATAHSPRSNNVNEMANSFLRQYISYQKEHYPSLDLSTKEDKNGWWTDYRTELGNVFINHKIQEGYVDLTIPKASDKTDRAKIIAEWARQHKIKIATVVKTKKSVMLRMHVPKLNIQNGFEKVDTDELNQCFDAIKELTDFANIIEMTNSVTSK